MVLLPLGFVSGHQRNKLIEQGRDVVGAWAGFRVSLEAEGGLSVRHIP